MTVFSRHLRKVLLTVVYIASATHLRADLSTLRCTSTITPTAPDAEGGYLFQVSAACNEPFERLEVHAGGQPVSPNRYGGPNIYGGGLFVCFNTSSCSGIARFTCMENGEFNLRTAVTAYDVPIPGVNESTSFAYSDGDATLALSFGLDAFGRVQGIVTYSMPQKVWPRHLVVSFCNGGCGYAISPLLPPAGRWVIPFALSAGGSLDVRAGDCPSDAVFGTSGGPHLTTIVPNVSFGAQQFAWISFDTPQGGGGKHEKALTSNEVEINVPLGTVFAVGLEKKQGALEPIQPITAIYSAVSSSPQPDVMPLPTATAMPRTAKLFAGSAIIQTDDDDAATRRKYVAVHLGKATLNLLPINAGDPPRTIRINVIKPTALGARMSGFDTYFINVAHNAGIPPQYLKGQARQEMFGSHFQADNWRYEPCGADLAYVSGGARKISNDPNFAEFRLDDAVGRSLHPGIPDEIDPRSRFFIVRPDPTTGIPQTRRIEDDDLGVTAREIWDNNNHPGVPGRVNWNFDTGCQRARLAAISAPNSTALDFIAQTPTATSSGLLQVMWDEAVNPTYWDGVTIGGINAIAPKFVFDKTEYVNVGGGSLSIGATIDVTNWPSSAGGRVKFSTFDEFEKLINKMMKQYNRYWNGGTYGDEVVRYSRSFAPSEPTTVFP